MYENHNMYEWGNNYMLITEGTIIKDGEGNEYILGEMLGSGGFGAVYKAFRQSDNSIYAVKTLHPNFNNNLTLESFQNEIEQSSQVQNEYVIQYVYAHDGLFYSDYPPYIIMEFANNGTLRELIAQQNDFLGSEALIQIFLQLSNGMNAINKILVHRDIKPENILIVDGVPKISDFGLSKFAGESTRTLTFKAYGSAKYVAPEAWNNDKNTIQMDIYSMGIVFYELATLNYPYNIDSGSDIMALRNAHLHQGIINPREFNSSIPAKLISLINKMLAKSVQERFKSWEEIINLLQIEMPTDTNLSGFVEKALYLQNESDLRAQALSAKNRKSEQEQNDFFGLIYYQIKSSFFDPINNFDDNFNSSYAGSNKIKFEIEHEYVAAHRFLNVKQTLPSRDRITYEFEIIYKRSFTRQVQTNTIFGSDHKATEQYTPQYNERDIMAWGKIEDKDHIGFNVLLLSVEDEIYGEWHIMTNDNSGLANTHRVAPFGFDLSELPDELTKINIMHTYTSNFEPFDINYLLQYITDRLN